ncbi:MAG: F0F1 ATP synthase subunit epsilon [Candidatus Eiseniibacteriota bacterium]
MADKVEFELVSPERLILSQAVDMVVVPGAEGDFGVLPGHALFLSTVRPGIIAVHNEGAVRERIFVGGGFAEVTPERCTVLADEAVPVKDIDRAAVEGRLKDLREDLGDAKTDEQRALLTRRVQVAEAMLEAAGSVS